MRFGPFYASVLLLGFSMAAQADSGRAPVGGTGGGFSGSGNLYGSGNPDGSYTITGIDGTGVTGLISAGGFNGNDNLIFPFSSPALDGQGFGFTDTQDDTDFQVDLYYSNAMSSYAAEILDSDGVAMNIPVSFNLGTPSRTDTALGRAIADDVSTMNNGAEAFSFSFAAAGAAATPEPASFALLGTGFLGLATVLRRRPRA